MIDYSLLALQNPWWRNKELIEKDAKVREFMASVVQYVPREVLDWKLVPGAVNVISGPRQTGKTTALKLLIRSLLAKQIPAERILYFNCDALESRKDIIDLVLGFFDGLHKPSEKVPPNYLFLDEVSSVTDWPYAIKWLVDEGLLAKSKVILTGSSSINLKKSGEFLPGRRGGGIDIRFLPISFFEYSRLVLPDFSLENPAGSFEELEKLEKQLLRKRADLKKVYWDFLLTGGFLKVVNLLSKKEPLAEAAELYQGALKSELAKFRKKELHARRVLDKVIRSLTAETSYANVAEEAELGSKNTAADYLGFFADSFLLAETLFYSVPQKRVVIKKNKKYYPTDPFLLWVFNSFVSGSNQIEEFHRRYLTPPLDSQLAEAFVASELYKSGLEFYYFRNSRGLDFYIPEGDLGVEVKYKEKITSSDLESLRCAGKKVIVSKNTLEKRGDVLIIPAHLWGLVETP